ncbi:MAG: hypothetical protein ACRC7O_18530 [Fimbriiglobus sp.]
MSRTAILSLFAAAVAASSGTGCRALRNRNDDHCGSTSQQPPACATSSVAPFADAYPVSMGRVPTTASMDCPGGNCGQVVSGGMTAVPTSYGGPIYPVGEPVPLRPSAGVSAPANELPYPTIPGTNLPESPTGATGPMYHPPVGARTTADPRAAK